ncbi:hypothetical protein J2754_003033 [Halarchaeum solikamskense]|nr:hypothetical protein [Halarchaeum solikamskense]
MNYYTFDRDVQLAQSGYCVYGQAQCGKEITNDSNRR